jgi:hypothetical protein
MAWIRETEKSRAEGALVLGCGLKVSKFEELKSGQKGWNILCE